MGGAALTCCCGVLQSAATICAPVTGDGGST